MQPIVFVFVACLAMVTPSLGFAKVIEQNAEYFEVAGTIPSKMSPQATWRQLLSIADYWDPSHSFSGNSLNLFIDTEKDMCFCEKWQASRVVHLQVVRSIPQRSLVLRGALGPLQNQPVVGALEIVFKFDKGNLFIDWRYRVSGSISGGVAAWSAPVDGVLNQQFSRLQKILNKEV